MDPEATPHYSREQIRKVDELAVSRYRMPSILLMENAARSAAVMAGRLLRDKPGEVLVLAGSGNNGGDGLGLARFLANAGRDVTIALLDPEAKMSPDAAVNFEICTAMNIRTERLTLDLLARPVAMVVDAMFGTGLTRPLTGLSAAVAKATEVLHEHRPELCILAMDLPSGLDADTGLPVTVAGSGEGDGTCVLATHTVTFGGPKKGFLNPESRRWTGEIVIGDIGVPRACLEAALVG